MQPNIQIPKPSRVRSYFDWTHFTGRPDVALTNGGKSINDLHPRAPSSFGAMRPGDSIGFADWLPFAARAYNLSDNPDDYFLRPTIGLVSDLPNRNGAGFPLSELVAWRWQEGRQSFKTWSGKPMFEEHGMYHPDPDNPSPNLAIGIIADVELTPVVGYGNDQIWKVLMLAAIDRTAGYKCFDKDLPRKYESNERNSYSMGCLVDYYTCAYCGVKEGRCDHIHKDEPLAFRNINGRLAYRLCHGISGQELSCVADPAAGMAVSDSPILRLNTEVTTYRMQGGR